jgi:hypothetical protein
LNNCINTTQYFAQLESKLLEYTTSKNVAYKVLITFGISCQLAELRDFVLNIILSCTNFFNSFCGMNWNSYGCTWLRLYVCNVNELW